VHLPVPAGRHTLQHAWAAWGCNNSPRHQSGHEQARCDEGQQHNSDLERNPPAGGPPCHNIEHRQQRVPGQCPQCSSEGRAVSLAAEQQQRKAPASGSHPHMAPRTTCSWHLQLGMRCWCNQAYPEL
jgi:hypothetical protein